METWEMKIMVDDRPTAVYSDMDDESWIRDPVKACESM